MTLSLLILLVVLTALATWRPTASQHGSSRTTPVHPSLRHLMNDPEIRRD
jgi:hypothetical protein